MSQSRSEIAVQSSAEAQADIDGGIVERSGQRIDGALATILLTSAGTAITGGLISLATYAGIITPDILSAVIVSTSTGSMGAIVCTLYREFRTRRRETDNAKRIIELGKHSDSASLID